LLAEGGITAAEVMSWVASLGTITIAVTSSAIASVSYAPSLLDDGITERKAVEKRNSAICRRVAAKIATDDVLAKAAAEVKRKPPS
jgi:hypothetical protein